ncbi:MAG: PAS domain S-box-containing protein, partial [Candidatus Azotimanducaceae bacterium]
MQTFQGALDSYARELLPLCLRLFIFSYVLIAGSHALLLSAETAGPMIGVAVLCVFFGLLIRANLEKPFIQDNAERVFVLLLLLMTTNVVLHMILTEDIRQTTNFVFVLVVAGYLLPSNKLFYFMAASLIVAWFILLATVMPLDGDLVHFGFVMLLGSISALFFHSVHRTQLRQMAELSQTALRLEASRKKISGAESVMTSLLDYLPAGVVVRGRDTRVLYANVEAKRQLGHEIRRGMTLDESAPKLVKVDGSELLSDQYPVNRTLHSGEPVTNELVGIQREDQEIIWGLVNAFMQDLGGDEGEVVIVAFVNITDQVNAELRLLETESRGRAILQSIRDGVISVDGDNKITLFNPGAEMLTGRSSQMALGQLLDDVVEFEQTEAVGLADSAILQGLLTSANGEVLEVERRVAEIVGGAEHIGWVHTFRDVREQRKLEHERTTLDKMTSVGALAAGIAHDFNNLLTTIYGNIALAESVLPDSERARVFLKRSSESIRQATNLTRRLVTFSGGSEPLSRVVELEPLVREATIFALSGSSVKAEFDIEENLNAVNVDPVQVQQAISNVVHNAKDALQDQGVIDIRIAFAESSGTSREVAVYIADRGPGMKPDLMAKIFDPYFTTKANGRGLGLATTHSIVTKHGGTISVTSSPGEGAIFVIRLPSADSVQQITRRVSVLEPKFEDDAFKVLVMDDDEVVLETVSKLLEQLGHDVERAADGAAAIELYQDALDANGKFDFVIMDLTVVGGMGGMAAAEKILGIDSTA